jgi:hypothetical protein
MIRCCGHLITAVSNGDTLTKASSDDGSGSDNIVPEVKAMVLGVSE